MKFVLESTKNKARAGYFETSHGRVETPIFMPVGTNGTIKALGEDDIAKTQAQIILANSYHLYLRPGLEILEKAGGLHQFMGHQGPILTDSGGFQVFSLGEQANGKTGKQENSQAKLVKITPDGVEFTSHLDGSRHFFSPEGAINIQRSIGADIMMAFDQCTSDNSSYQQAKEAADLTYAWAKRCKAQFKSTTPKYSHQQYLFGIIQGGLHSDLRQQSAREIISLDFDGIALGGETIGYNMAGTGEVMAQVEDLLPSDKPRYAMGLGRDPQDIIDATLMGFDMFDCVGPTRLARNGSLFVGRLEIKDDVPFFDSLYPKGRLQIGNAQFKSDFTPLDDKCGCDTCRAGYSRAYLHHLYKTQELLYYRLASVHNVWTMINLSRKLREWIGGN